MSHRNDIDSCDIIPFIVALIAVVISPSLTSVGVAVLIGIITVQIRRRKW